MADTMNDTRTPSEILADAVKLAEKTGHSYITVTNVCAERIIELLKEQQPKTGHWKNKSDDPEGLTGLIYCSECGGVCMGWRFFCSRCGAKMDNPL